METALKCIKTDWLFSATFLISNVNLTLASLSRPVRIKIIPFWDTFQFQINKLFTILFSYYIYTETKSYWFNSCPNLKLALAMIWKENKNTIKIFE